MGTMLLAVNIPVVNDDRLVLDYSYILSVDTNAISTLDLKNSTTSKSFGYPSMQYSLCV